MSLFQRQKTLAQQLSQRHTDAIGLTQSAPPETMVFLLQALLEREHRWLHWRWVVYPLTFVPFFASTSEWLEDRATLTVGIVIFPLSFFLSRHSRHTSTRWKKGLASLLFVLPLVSPADALRPLLWLASLTLTQASWLDKGQRKWIRERLILILSRLPSQLLRQLGRHERSRLIILASHPRTNPELRCAALLALADVDQGRHTPRLTHKLEPFQGKKYPERVREAAREYLKALSDTSPQLESRVRKHR